MIDEHKINVYSYQNSIQIFCSILSNYLELVTWSTNTLQESNSYHDKQGQSPQHSLQVLIAALSAIAIVASKIRRKNKKKYCAFDNCCWSLYYWSSLSNIRCSFVMVIAVLLLLHTPVRQKEKLIDNERTKERKKQGQ